jgi:hypothetical protein
MKQLFFLLLCSFKLTVTFSQKVDTIRTYRYENFLQVSFTIHSNSSFTIIEGRQQPHFKGKVASNGKFLKFVMDTSNMDRIDRGTCKYILSRFHFIKTDSLLHAPLMEVDPKVYMFLNDSAFPPGIFATYLKGDGFGGSVIHLFPDSTYKLCQFADVGGDEDLEVGHWKIKDHVLTFIPPKGTSFLKWYTQDNQLFLYGNFLIGRKATKEKQKSGKVIIHEIFQYFVKMPVLE